MQEIKDFDRIIGIIKYYLNIKELLQCEQLSKYINGEIKNKDEYEYIWKCFCIRDFKDYELVYKGSYCKVYQICLIFTKISKMDLKDMLEKDTIIVCSDASYERNHAKNYVEIFNYIYLYIYNIYIYIFIFII